MSYQIFTRTSHRGGAPDTWQPAASRLRRRNRG